jgi:hypothetical protein
MERSIRILATCCALGLAAGCEGGGGSASDAGDASVADARETPTPDDWTVEAPAETGFEVDAVTGATKLIVDSTHAGWKNPECWSCHTPDGHDAGQDPYLCIECHGTNGSSAGHAGGTPCSGCHSPLPHGTEGFPDPLSCKACHVP